MAIEYDVFIADGPLPLAIDYTTPYDTTSDTEYVYGPIGPAGNVALAVRARDTDTGLTEQNVDAVIFFSDVRGFTPLFRPAKPQGITVQVTAGSTALVRWAYIMPMRGVAPTGFKVWKNTGSSVNFAGAPVATIPYSGQFYKTLLSGVSHGTQYAIGVRAYDGDGDDGNEVSFVITGNTTAPNPVEDLSASTTFAD